MSKTNATNTDKKDSKTDRKICSGKSQDKVPTENTKTELTKVIFEKKQVNQQEGAINLEKDEQTTQTIKTSKKPGGQEFEEVIEYEETRSTTPTVTKISKKTLPTGVEGKVKPDKNTVTTAEIEQTRETKKIKPRPNAKGGKEITIEQEETKVTTKTKTITTDIKAKAINEKTTGTATSDKNIKSKKGTAAKTTDKPQEEPQVILTTNKIENGTEYITTTIFPDGTKKIETRTVYDAVEVSGDEEEIEEYEEIDDEEDAAQSKDNKSSKDATELSNSNAAATDDSIAARKKLKIPDLESKQLEKEQINPNKLKIPAAFAAANAAPLGPIKPLLKRGIAPSTISAAKKNEPAPVPPPRKKEIVKVTTPTKK